MININVDLGNVPSVLAALADTGNAQRVVNAMAERYVTEVHDFIDAGRGFTPHTGQLQQSINWHPNGNGAATVYANADYAEAVEFGTAAHVIRPRDRRALRFPAGGGSFGFARVINHPGSRPHPYFFADQSTRSANMQAAGLSVLARILANG